jgi:hypothetical protein
MTIYICIAANVPGYSPDYQDYHSCESYEELRDFCAREVVEFIGDEDPADFDIWPFGETTEASIACDPDSCELWLSQDKRSGRILIASAMTEIDYVEQTQ